MCLSIALHRPNDVLAKGEHAGFEWMVIHNGTGYRCGYVRVPLGHPWHGKSYHEIDASVHGGLTFGEPDEPCDKGGADNAFWFGFDCCHGGDWPDPSLPGASRGKYADSPFGLMNDLMELSDELTATNLPTFAGVRSQEYVEAECRSLCEQARDAALVTIA